MSEISGSYTPLPIHVTMESLKGAEVCEMVALYWLNILKTKIWWIICFKDNGLTCFENKSRPKLEKNKKKIRKFSKDKGLNIAINVSFHIADYLDVKFNLTLGKCYPHRKQNSTLHYIHNQSNHPS